jgi:phage virion morphogenesis protein
MISIEIKDTGVTSALERISRKSGNMAGALNIIGERMLRHTDEHFTKEQDADGRPWKPLKPATLRHKKGAKILTESNHLRDSIRHQVGGNTLRVGTNRPYGAIHQFGGRAGRGRRVNIPARPYLGIGERESKEIVQIVTEWMEVK